MQPSRDKYSDGRSALENFSNFFVAESKRNLFLNYTLSSATPHDYKSFNFNQELHRENRAGFLWITQNNVKGNFYNVKINNSGGISLRPLRSTWNFAPNKDIFNKL